MVEFHIFFSILSSKIHDRQYKVKTDEMNFHMGYDKFHLLSEVLRSPESIPMKMTRICRIRELLNSANRQTAQRVGIQDKGGKICLLGCQDYFPSHFSPTLPPYSIFFSLLLPKPPSLLFLFPFPVSFQVSFFSPSLLFSPLHDSKN